MTWKVLTEIYQCKDVFIKRRCRQRLEGTMIYLDYAANTPVDALVLEEFIKSTTTYIANPNSTHPLGKKAYEKMNEVTKDIAN